jgi:hypothetical protein
MLILVYKSPKGNHKVFAGWMTVPGWRAKAAYRRCDAGIALSKAASWDQLAGFSSGRSATSAASKQALSALAIAVTVKLSISSVVDRGSVFFLTWKIERGRRVALQRYVIGVRAGPSLRIGTHWIQIISMGICIFLRTTFWRTGMP